MLFNSLSFLIFFPIVTILYYLFPSSLRWLLLLVASSFFYMAFIPQYILILVFLITLDYFAGHLIQKTQGQKRKYILIASLLANIGTLFVFKYFNFFNTNFTLLANFLHWNYSISLLQLILPVGLSFHTFQSMSYVIEVYKRKQKAEPHFGIYALYVMFYPQLVAGPIERPQHLLNQFHKIHPFKESNITEGLRRMLLGFFKKIVIADRLALLVNLVYGAPHEYIGLPLLLATIAFAFQIYCDFSGYSDIAIGAARVMGFNLVENFNYPYLAKSIQDFWRRWHMSLYAWFRDYIYIPLGGSHVSPFRHYINILIVFFITGLWHGANWTFIVWGMIHGVSMLINEIVSKYKIKLEGRIADGLKMFLTFSLICVAWVFFRASSLQDALYIITSFPRGIGSFVNFLLKKDYQSAGIYFFHQGQGIGLDAYQLLIVFLALVVLAFVEYKNRHGLFTSMPLWLRWGISIFLVLTILNFGTTYLIPFIYFQF